jgi:hypothetical protein
MDNERTNQSTSGGTDLQNLTEQIEEGIRTGKYSWREIQGAETTDVYVHENPWKVVGIGAGLGFVLGLLMAPRSHRFDE